MKALSEENPLLAEWGWRRAFAGASTQNSYLRINTVMGANQPWIFAKLDELKKSWRVTVSYRAPGRDCLLRSFTESDLLLTLKKAQEAIDAYEASMRMGWVP